MSASWNKKRVIYPFIPNEIWLHIFELATCVPGIFDPDVRDPFDIPMDANSRLLDLRFEQSHIRKSLLTKRRIVRVCKLWCALATPLLYQAVILRHMHCVHSLHSTLMQQCARAEVPLGFWVHRADVNLRFDRDKGDGNAEDLSVLAEVIRCFPNLRVLAVASQLFAHPSGDTMADLLCVAVGASCSPQLLKLIWAFDIHPSDSAFSALFKRMPQLRTLVVGPEDPQADFCPLALPPLPDLRFVTVAHMVEEADTMILDPFPNLQQILLRWVADSTLACLSDFLRFRAPDITTAYLSMDLGPAAMICFTLAENCPRLTRIVLIADRWSSITENYDGYFFSNGGGAGDLNSVPFLPPVTHLGLACTQNQASNVTYRRVFVWLTEHDPSSLKVVRFMNPKGLKDLHNRHSKVLTEGLAGLPALRVEDHQGIDLRLEAAVVPQTQQVGSAISHKVSRETDMLYSKI